MMVEIGTFHTCNTAFSSYLCFGITLPTPTYIDTRTLLQHRKTIRSPQFTNTWSRFYSHNVRSSYSLLVDWLVKLILKRIKFFR